MELIKFVDYSVYYKLKRDQYYVALKNLNFSIQSGEFLVVVGPSGCGKTRGKNRFITLYLILEKLNGEGVNEDLRGLKDFAENSPELSNGALEKKIAETGDLVLKKALAWSLATNESIGKLSFADKRAFDGVKEFLAFAQGKADIAIVSSANFTSVEEEWNYYGLSEFVSVITTQENGTKTECINKLAALGYGKDNIIMLGDAPMDLHSAEAGGVLFYPVFSERETESWLQFKEKYFAEFLNGKYKPSQSKLLVEFACE